MTGSGSGRAPIGSGSSSAGALAIAAEPAATGGAVKGDGPAAQRLQAVSGASELAVEQLLKQSTQLAKDVVFGTV